MSTDNLNDSPPAPPGGRPRDTAEHGGVRTPSEGRSIEGGHQAGESPAAVDSEADKRRVVQPKRPPGLGAALFRAMTGGPPADQSRPARKLTGHYTANDWAKACFRRAAELARDKEQNG